MEKLLCGSNIGALLLRLTQRGVLYLHDTGTISEYYQQVFRLSDVYTKAGVGLEALTGHSGLVGFGDQRFSTTKVCLSILP